jgi:hypothetical protein
VSDPVEAAMEEALRYRAKAQVSEPIEYSGGTGELDPDVHLKLPRLSFSG